MMLKNNKNNNTQLHITVIQTLIKAWPVIIDIKNINGDRSEGGISIIGCISPDLK